MSKIAFISVFIDPQLYANCVSENRFVNQNPNISIIGIDNRTDNQSISRRYNQFLNGYDYSDPRWFVFCHSDWELLEDLEPLLENLDINSIYGPIGAILHRNEDGKLTREYRGQCYERKRDGSKLRQLLCRINTTNVPVDTLDCQCMIVHSSLVESYKLRFDEKLNFNLYVEDFCINSRESHSVESKILNIQCCHWNQADNMDGREEYFVDLKHCNSKYTKNIYAGIVTLIGSSNNEIVFQNQYTNIEPKIIDIGSIDDPRSNIYKVNRVDPEAQNDSKSMIYRYIANGASVLDVGCACGDLGVVLHNLKNCKVYGFEYSSASIDIANTTESYKEIHQVDLNCFQPEQYAKYKKKFDFIVFGDVLEHVYKPDDVVKKMISYLNDDGHIIISLPNLSHASIKAALLLNDFSYTDVGLLDKTHIRFFTSKTIPEFLANNLLKIQDFQCTALGMEGFQPDNPYPNLPINVKQNIFADPHSFVCQYVMKLSYEPRASFNECLIKNMSLIVIDENRFPLISAFRDKAISIYAPFNSASEKHSTINLLHRISCSFYFKKFHALLVKLIVALFLLPASFVYARGLLRWIDGISKGRVFFLEVLNNQNTINYSNKARVLSILIKGSFNRALLLNQTKSIRFAFRGFTSIYSKLCQKTDESTKKSVVKDLASEILNSESQINYQSFIERYEPTSPEDIVMLKDDISAWHGHPLLLLHLNVSIGQLEELKSSVDSILIQYYKFFTLCITYAENIESDTVDYLNSISKNPKIKIFKLSVEDSAENAALKNCCSKFFIPIGTGDLIPEFSLYFVAKEILLHPNARIIYSDNDILAMGERCKPYFKSDWNEELFLSQDYLSRMVAFNCKNLAEIGGFRKNFEPVQIYDAALRLVLGSDGRDIHHIPRILYHFKSEEYCIFNQSNQIQAKNAVISFLEKKKIVADVTTQESGTNRIIYKVSRPMPMVSCLVAMRDKSAITELCIQSILSHTDYESYEIVLIDNGSVESESLNFLDRISKEKNVRIINWNHPFNYSEIQNIGVRESKGDFIALLNNDIVIEESGWLKEMIGHAQKSHVGAVGTKLLFQNDTLQHGGIILGPNGCVGHAFRDLPERVDKHKAIAQSARWISAVTGACLVVKKSKYLEIGGLNEKDLSIAFNDVDFCIRLFLAGYQNIYTPHTKIYHLESASRGFDNDPDKKKRADKELDYIRRNYGHLLRKDPQYNPNLSFFGTNYDVIRKSEFARL